MSSLRTWASAHRLDLVTLAAIAAVVVLLWLPFGWNVSPLTDAWVVLDQVQQGVEVFHPLSVRPFVETFQALGYWLTPDSFVGLNLVFAALVLARSFALYLAVAELLPNSRVLASATALLYTIFYADLGAFWLGTHGILWSNVWTFIALWLLVRQLRRPVRWLWLAVAGAQALALTYEAAFPVVFAAPLVLPLAEGRINRRVLVTAALWYIAPALLAARYVATAAANDQAYQSNQLATALNSQSPLLDMANSVIRIFKRLLGGAFLDRYTMWRETLPTLPYAAAITAVSTGAVWIGLRWQPPAFRWREVITAGVAGLALVGFGFAAYLVSEYRDVDYRVYYVSAAGSALFFITALFAIAYGGKWVRRAVAVGALGVIVIIAPRLGKLALAIGALLNLLLPARGLFLLGFALLIGLHSAFTLWQHRLYAESPQGQHWILSAIIEQAPQPADGTLIVLLDESPESRALLEFENRRDMLIGALRYLYGNTALHAAFCVPEAGVFGLFREACAFTEDGFYTRWTKFALDERTVPYANVLVFAFDEEDGARLLTDLPAPAEGYSPLTIAGQGEPLPARALSALEDFPTPKPGRWIDWGMLH